MFNITKDKLSQFGEEGLEELVYRLCEAEVRHAREPASSVKWRGALTAPDEGIDVEVCVETHEFAGDFVRRAQTGFQIKSSSLPAGEITKEMSPKGLLRPAIADLAQRNGSYILVSLADDPSGRALANRKEAMRKQIESIDCLGDLRTEFYGRSDLIHWLRQHPGVQLWVREKLGIPLNGWKPFGRWTNIPPGIEDNLICGEGVSVSLPGRETEKLDIVQGIDGIRKLVRISGTAVRIVGLSGVGKSRIVQALFEETVGSEALDRSLAVYADLGEEPNPSARLVFERLLADKRPAIMILDNCPSETHRQLASDVAYSPDIRLVTVEFDIREDRPEATSVVRIEAEGPEIAENLIKRRYPGLGQVNTRRIAEISCGNARLALALADAVGDSLSDFSDAELFDRLLYQRGEPDNELDKAAEVLALVYSFSISLDEAGVDELGTLAGIIGGQRRDLYRAAQTLLDRQLAQKRGDWRAVLPHALANRLAANGLKNIPVQDILDALQEVPSRRLLKSFGRRLGFLHDHEVSQIIVESWISPGGLLHDLLRLDEELMQLLLSVAPVAPECVVSAIEAQEAGETVEKFFSNANRYVTRFTRVLNAIAHEPSLFERCVNLIARFALAEISPWRNDSALLGDFFSLFWLKLSGTEAGPEIRERVTRRFLGGTRNEQRLGMRMLASALKNSNWSAMRTFEFGARPRSYGYIPKTREEEDQWFAQFCALAEDVATGTDAELSAQARDLLARELRGLWHRPRLRPALMALAQKLNVQRRWLEGWVAVRSIKHYDYQGSDDHEALDDAELLNELDQALRPKRLSDVVRTHVLGTGSNHFELDEEFDFASDQKWQESSNRAAARAHDLGIAVAREPGVLDELAQDFFTSARGNNIEFGKGLASDSSDLEALWKHLVRFLERAGDQARQCDVLNGVLEVVHERAKLLAQRILDEAVHVRALRGFIVRLQSSTPFGQTSLDRLHKALDFEDTPLEQFGSVAWQQPFSELSEADLRSLMLEILDKPSGAEVVLDCLGMRLYTMKTENLAFGSDLKRLGLLASAALLRRQWHELVGNLLDHELPVVLEHCMDEADFPEETSEVLEAYFVELRESYGYLSGATKLVAVLAEKATFRFLDGVFFDPDLNDYHRRGVFEEGRNGKSPLCGVCVATLLEWCQQGTFQERLVMISEAVFPFEEKPDSERAVLSAHAHAIIDAADDPAKVLDNLSYFVQPSGWTGSLAETIERRRQAFEILLEHDRPEVCTAADALITKIREWEGRERRQERAFDEEREQRFE